MIDYVSNAQQGHFLVFEKSKINWRGLWATYDQFLTICWTLHQKWNALY